MSFSQADGGGTIAAEDRLKKAGKTEEEENASANNGLDATAVPINENLFLDEDLDALDEELNDLEIEQ